MKKTSIGQKFGPKNMAQTDLAVKWMIGSTKKTGPIGGTHVGTRRICLVRSTISVAPGNCDKTAESLSFTPKEA